MDSDVRNRWDRPARAGPGLLRCPGPMPREALLAESERAGFGGEESEDCTRDQACHDQVTVTVWRLLEAQEA